MPSSARPGGPGTAAQLAVDDSRPVAVDERAVRAEAVRLLYQSPFPAVANLAVGTLLAIVAWDALPGWVPPAWLVLMTAVTVARLWLWQAFRRSAGATCDATRWERRMTVGVAAAGMLWGITGLAIAFWRLPVHVEGVVAISVGGMIAGAVFSITASAPAFRAYVIPAAAGRTLGFLAVGTLDHVAVAGMGAVYLFVVLMWGRDAQRAIVNGIRLRLENEALVADLNAVREQLDAAEKLKRESFANLGHELRTPLNAIIGFAESLEVELWGPLGSPRYRDYARAIGDSGRHLYELIQGILDIARHDAGILEIEESRFDLAELARSCAVMMDGSARSSGVQLSTLVPEDGMDITGDATKLRQIVINLVANAVRFTPSGGTVTVIVERREGGEVEIRVEDDGVGLAPEDIPRALEPFVQVARNGARDSGGAGLGLPLSKRLAELHGGRLEIDSRPGDGTVVRVILPAIRAVDPA